jgi:hypothetical protein
MKIATLFIRRNDGEKGGDRGTLRLSEEAAGKQVDIGLQIVL